MRYLILILLLTGCATNYDRDFDGCESYKYLCIGCYDHCGKKNTDMDQDSMIDAETLKGIE